MSDFDITAAPPKLVKTCRICDGKRYLVDAPEPGQLPTPTWCFECSGRGYLPSDFGRDVLWFLDKFGGRS